MKSTTHSTPPSSRPDPASTYAEALRQTAPEQIGRPEPGSDLEAEAVERFRRFFEALTEDRVRRLTRETYAENAWFYDTLKVVQGAGAIEDYFVETAGNVESCTVEVNDVARSGDDHYVRWTMDIQFKRFKRGTTCRSVGMTHLRFDREGKIALHHDYWDAASGLFEYVPVLGSAIRAIKRRV